MRIFLVVLLGLVTTSTVLGDHHRTSECVVWFSPTYDIHAFADRSSIVFLCLATHLIYFFSKEMDRRYVAIDKIYKGEEAKAAQFRPRAPNESVSTPRV